MATETTKPGVQTTELWTTLVAGSTGLVTAFTATDVVTRCTALACFTLLACVYVVTRSYVKGCRCQDGGAARKH